MNPEKKAKSQQGKLESSKQLEFVFVKIYNQDYELFSGDLFGTAINYHFASEQRIITMGSHSPSNINPAVNLLQLSLNKYQIARYPYKTPNINAGTNRIKIPVSKQ